MNGKEKNNEEKHISVLLNELVENIDIFENKKNIIVDTTLGMAGHAKKIIEKLYIGDIFIGFDADARNLVLAKEILENYFEDKINIVFAKNFVDDKINVILINSNFLNLISELEKRDIKNITGIYYDLGISSLHVDENERGFSFKNNGPLDMRFDNTKGKNAADIINSYTQSELRRIFIEYGEESNSNKIANKIIETRKIKKITTTKELAILIDETANFPKTKTRIFQALRIEVNKELENIEKSIKDAIKILEKNGKIFVISFHSLEDRIIKQIFKIETKDCICKDIICTCKHKKSLKILYKKPILPTKNEIENNHRSRSAKARCAIKI